MTTAQKTQNVLRSSLVTMGPSLALVLGLVTGSMLAITLVLAPAPASWVLRAYAAGALLLGVIWMGLRFWYWNWGATDEERSQSLTGDEIIPRPTVDMTRAVTVNAKSKAVWAWLVQMGQGRGGLFSYDWLENLAGLDIHTLDHIAPELQTLNVGDAVPLGPGPNNGFFVAAIEPGRVLSLRLCDSKRGGAIDHTQSRWVDVTWSFFVVPIASDRTRLISRFRVGSRPERVVALAYALLLEIPHFVMERKMLLGIKQRAERLSS
jgi:hypothetical protein